MKDFRLTSRNFYRSARQTALGQARECLRWLRIHRERHEWTDAENVRQAFFGYLTHARRLSRMQKEADARWAALGEIA